EKPSFETLSAAKSIKDPGKRLKKIVETDDRVGAFAWAVTAHTLVYAGHRIPEIADTVHAVDQAMCWGFNREIGPFVAWDAIGLVDSVARMKKEGLSIPLWIQTMVDAGHTSFYKEEGGQRFQYHPAKQEYIPIVEDPKVVHIKKLPSSQKVDSNDGATLWDMGDSVLLYEMHTKMNAVDNETIEMLGKAVDAVEQGRFDALVLANNGKNFSVGANLMLVLMAVQSDALGDVEKMLKSFQDVNMRMKYCRGPVIAAPVGYAFGGGLELCLHADRVVGAAETYAGLVEVGVGLIPAAGGTKEFVLRAVEGVDMKNSPSLLPFVRNAFEHIAMAKVATSFKDAQALGILRGDDIMVAHPEHRISRAKEVALGMLEMGYMPGHPREDIPVVGESGAAAFMIAVDGMKDAGWASPHDQLIANALATIIGGGARAEGQTISEQELLDLERETFMRLLGEEKTLERIQHMLLN
ncbi:MAG: enoyl-CoA hydratase/isomerase family protein, partial [Myxococcota bacterium]